MEWAADSRHRLQVFFSCIKSFSCITHWLYTYPGACMAQVCPGCSTVTNQLVAAIKYQVQVVHIINIYTGCLLVRILHRCLSGPRSTVATLHTH